MFGKIFDVNIIGMRNAYEAAGLRCQTSRLGQFQPRGWIHRRDQTIDHTVYPKPDSRYGVSKVFGEAMGSLYADKYGLEVVVSYWQCRNQATDKRRLAIWISPRDLAQLCSIGLDHPGIKFEVYAASKNRKAGAIERRTMVTARRIAVTIR